MCLDFAGTGAHNCIVQGCIRRFAAVSSLLLVVLSLALSPLAALRDSAAAMACCAKTNYACAGLSAPDDCCQHMGHAAHGVTPGTVSTARDLLIPIVAIVPSFAAETMAAASNALGNVSTFTRPHDPPHLHSYSLLI
jgi:hypothetical protein